MQTLWCLTDPPLADCLLTHRVQQHNTGGVGVWYNNHVHHSALNIFTLSDQTMLQFIHKLLMLSKKALGTAAFLFILAVLCTALVVPVGSLAHGPAMSQAAPHSKLWFKTAMDLVPAPNSSAFRSRYMTDYFARGKSHNQSGEQIIISELHCACTPCRFAKQTLSGPTSASS